MQMIARTESLRQHNRSLILAALRKNGDMSHTDLAEWSGLSSATVSAITSDLLSEKVIVKIEPQSNLNSNHPISNRGRPRILFKHNADIAYVAIIRMTLDAIEYSLVDYCGTLKDRFSEKYPFYENNDISSFICRFKDNSERLFLRSNLDRKKLKTISITSDGLIAPDKTTLLWSPIFDNQHIDFKAILKDDGGAHILLTHEIEFAAKAIAKKIKNNPTDHTLHHIATLSLGHSISLGIATKKAEGQTLSKTPAFGHMIHNADGPVCRCGANGCIESYAGFYGILRTAFNIPNDIIPAKFIPLEQMDKLAYEAQHGDQMAAFAFRQAGEVLSIGLSRLMSIYGPMPIHIIGPGLKYLDLMQMNFETFLKKNIQIRYGEMPSATLHSNNHDLIYEGNIVNCLTRLDMEIASYCNHNLSFKLQQSRDNKDRARR